MRRTRALLAGLVTALVTSSAFAAPPPDELPRGRVQVVAQAHFGVATTPFEVSTLPRAKGQAFVFQTGARYTLSAPFSLELDVPWVLGSVAQPAGSYVDAAALGNAQLGARYRLVQRDSGAAGFGVDAALNVGLPLASHAADLMPNRVLAIANGVEGRGRPEWFTPGALPITPQGSARWASAAWSLEGALALPLLVRVSDADLPDATTNTKPVGFASLVFAEARYGFSQRCSLALAEQLFFDAVPFASHVGQVSPLQDFERLSLDVRLGSYSALSVDFQSAFAGELGGSMLAGGLRTVITL